MTEKNDTKYSKELRLLFLSSIINVSDDVENKILNLISDEFSWDLFLKLALIHGTYPLVYRNLSKIRQLNKKSENVSGLEKLYKENKMKIIKLSSELINVTKAFDKANIRSISLKGPALSMEVYDDLFMRSSGDLDILVGFDSLDMAESVLFQLGYKKIKNERNLSTKQLDYVKKFYHHFGYLNKNGVFIELHWRLHEFAKYDDFEMLYKNSKITKVFDEEIHVFNPEDNLMALILHGTKHGWTKLKWVCDVETILQNNNINWQAFMVKASKLNLSHTVGQALIITKELFDLEIPVELNCLMNNNISIRSANISLEFMLALSNSNLSRKKLLFKFYNVLWLNSKTIAFKNIINYFRPKIDDFNLVKMPDVIFFIYYLIRPIHYLARKFKIILN